MTVLTYEDILACAGLPVAIDTETTGLHWWKDGLIGIGIHCEAANVSGYVHTCRYEEVPYGKPKTRKVWNGQMDYSKSKRGRKVYVEESTQDTAIEAIPEPVRVKHFLKAVHQICQNPNTLLIGHNLKFDAHFLQLHLWDVPCMILDTSVLAHLLDSRQKKSLSAVEDTYLSTSTKRNHVSQADKRFTKSPWMWGEKVLEDYCTNDCVVTFQLAYELMPLIRERDLSKLLTLQMKYLRLLQKIEWRGIQVDPSFCHKAKEEFERNLISLENDLFDACGKEFNWRSPQQLSEAIYDGLAISKPENPFPVGSNNAAAKIYTESATGTPLLIKTKHPLASTVIDIRETYKLNEYAQKYLDLSDDNGAIHSSFNITGTVTGRLSSSEPNLQQLPSANRKFDLESLYTGGTARTGGYNLRQALVARPGYKIVSIDHKQQEARLLAILAQEQTMLQYMAERKDLHLAIAMQVWGDCGPEMNKIHRDWSKAVTFGVSYGMSPESLQEHFDKMGIAADAHQVMQDFFSTFPDLYPWFEQTVQDIEMDGYIRYWSGRYWFPNFLSEAYKGINARIQGGAGDFLSLVLVRANQVLEAQGWGYCISIIHDEALFEILEEHVWIAAPVLSRVFEGEDIFGVPFLTDIEVGNSYGSLESFKTDINIEEIDWKRYLVQKELT